MSQERAKRKRGRPTKGETVMTSAKPQASRMHRLKQAEATLESTKSAALMVCKWMDMLQMSLRRRQFPLIVRPQGQNYRGHRKGRDSR